MTCQGCNRRTDQTEKQMGAEYWWCSSCRRQYPSVLIKAHNDPYQYALSLVTSEVIEFSHCVIEGDWVSVDGRDVALRAIATCWQRQ